MTLSLEAFAARLPEIGTPSSHGFVLVELGASSAPLDAAFRASPSAEPIARAPLCLALAIDASSSMRGPRFAVAVQAARDLLDALGPDDRLAVVTFEREARLVLGPAATDAAGKAEARRALDRLSTGFGTNLGAGWREAADSLARLVAPGSARRILLLTDGMPSQGERDPDALARAVAEGRSRGLETTVLGIGDGIDERLCAALARAGDGRFHYARNEGALGDVVAREIEGARRLVAIDVELELTFTPRVSRAQVLHRYTCRAEAHRLQVRIGAVGADAPRAVLLQVEVSSPTTAAPLGTASARGRRPRSARRHDATAAGFALGARAAADGGGNASEPAITTPSTSIELAVGTGTDLARRRIAREVAALRSIEEVRGAWDAFDARDYAAVSRRLGRARDLRRSLASAGLLDPAWLASVPDLDAVELAIMGAGAAAREARRSFASWEHNAHASRAFAAVEPKGPARH